MDSFIERKIAQQLQEAARYFPAVVITGARQTGKTTLIKHMFPEYTYVSLDRPLTAEQAEQDPEAFLARFPAPVIIDEVQYAPSLFRYLKILNWGFFGDAFTGGEGVTFRSPLAGPNLLD